MLSTQALIELIAHNRTELPTGVVDALCSKLAQVQEQEEAARSEADSLPQVRRAAVALTYYDPGVAVTDLLADLMHLCLKRGEDFEDALRIARGHFDAESGGEE